MPTEGSCYFRLAFIGTVWMNTYMPNKPASITSNDDLLSLSIKQLRTLYQQILGHCPNPSASRNFLTGNLAWSMQALQQKKIPEKLRGQLLKRSHATVYRKKAHLTPGTRLIREWHGAIYEVMISEQGYLWRNQKYRSLTAIAREITGANWSGPRFFGITASNHDE